MSPPTLRRRRTPRNYFHSASHARLLSHMQLLDQSFSQSDDNSIGELTPPVRRATRTTRKAPKRRRLLATSSRGASRGLNVAPSTASAALPPPTIDLTNVERGQFEDQVKQSLTDFFKSGHFVLSDDDDDEVVEVPSDNPQPSTSRNIDQNAPQWDDTEFVDLTRDQSFEKFMTETQRLLDTTATMLNQIGQEPPQKPLVVVKEKAKPPELQPAPKPVADEEKEEDKDDKGLSCPVCLQKLGSVPVAATLCGHIFCEACIKQTAKTSKHCPVCRKSITLKKIHRLYLP